MGFLNQSPFQELFPVLIRNIKDVLYSQFFAVETRKPLATKFLISWYKLGNFPSLAYRKM